MTPDSFLLGLRFLRYGLAMLLWGTGLYVRLIAPAGVGARLQARLSPLPAAIAAGLVAVTALKLPLMAASFGDGWPDASRPETLLAVLQTWSGTAWMVDAALCLLLAASLGAAGFKWPATTAIAGILLAASVMTGHAAIGAGPWSPIHQLNDAAHLLAAGFWLGALPPLTLTLKYEGTGDDALRAVERFAVAGQAAVTVILCTGIANAILIKGATPLRWSSTYDVLLLSKVAVVLGMIGIACLNHFLLLPRLAARSNGAARAMRRNVLLEMLLGAAAVGLVSVFGMLDTE